MPFSSVMAGFEALTIIDVVCKTKPFFTTIELDPALIQRGIVLGSDDKALASALMSGSEEAWTRPLASSDFQIVHRTPGKSETIVFIHLEKHVGGFLEVKDEDATLLEARLQPTATLKGRLLDDLGNPRPRAELLILFDRRVNGSKNSYLAIHLPDRLATDQNGRFRGENLVPGLSYQFLVTKPGILETEGYLSPSKQVMWSFPKGESKDWGDVRSQKFGEE